MADQLINYVKPFGRPPKYKTAEELWNKFLGYVALMQKTPIQASMRSRKTDDKSTATDTDLRPHCWTLWGFQLYANIGDWTNFKKSNQYQTEDFRGVIRAIEDAIREHQVSGAQTGVYNSNLTARLNGISEKIESENKTTVSVQGLSDDDLKAEIDRIRRSIGSAE